MGFFDWLRSILGGGAGRAPVPGVPGAPDRRGPLPSSVPPPVPTAAAGTRPGAQRPERRVVRLDLDLVRYAPLSREEMGRRASRLGSAWRSPWFGRRDRIPPADDPRTNLIDRGMVGEGLAAAAELHDLHAVGKEMEPHYPALDAAAGLTYAAAAHGADAAGRADAEARAERKRQKQAEAAERRRKHAEAVARRRATDIVFLGRGVSSGLADRRAQVERLTAARLPVLATPADVAAALGLAIPRLRWLAFHNDLAARIHYVRFTVRKKSGGTRELAAPRPALAAAQRWILRNVLDLVPPHDAAHGFVRARSTVTNAGPHAGKAVVVNADLKDFFPTVTFPRVRGVFRWLGYSPAAATVLALLCTEAPRREVTADGRTWLAAVGPRALPQGAATSPALSNLVVRRMDARLAAIAAKLGLTYTRYADDLTFSGGAECLPKVGYLLARLRHIAQDEGFAVNEAKTRVQRRNRAQSVTGLVVNERPGVPRDVVRRLRAILHRARREGLAAQNREGREHFEAWVRGMVAYVAMVRPEQGAKLRAELDALSA